MRAAVYAREIAGTAQEEYRDAQWNCADCEASPYEWMQRGRCTGPLADGVAQLRVELDGVRSTATYPEQFTTCPMGLLRADLDQDAAVVAGLVSHAAAAEMEKRWPDIPARLYALIREWRSAESDRMRAEHEARMESVKGHGHR